MHKANKLKNLIIIYIKKHIMSLSKKLCLLSWTCIVYLIINYKLPYLHDLNISWTINMDIERIHFELKSTMLLSWTCID